MVDEQYALEMVHLVLQAGRQQAVDLFFILLALDILPARGDRRRSLDLGILIGHRETAFAVDIQIVGRIEYLGIDEHPRIVDHSVIMVAMFAMLMFVRRRFLQVDHQHPFRHADLDRGQPDAGRVIHGVEHVLDQPFEFVVKGRHGFGHGFQARIRHLEDR